MQLRDRQGDAQRIDDEDEPPRELPLEAGVAERDERPPGGPHARVSLDLVVLPSPQVGDGSFANNAWLQEMPHPLSKLTWDNAAYLAPKTAEALGVETGQRVLVVANGGRTPLPVVVLPGTPERTVVVELGYGRQGLGRVAEGVGGNAYPLRTRAALGGMGVGGTLPNAFFRSEPARLEMLGVRWVQVPATSLAAPRIGFAGFMADVALLASVRDRGVVGDFALLVELQ